MSGETLNLSRFRCSGRPGLAGHKMFCGAALTVVVNVCKCGCRRRSTEQSLSSLTAYPSTPGSCRLRTPRSPAPAPRPAAHARDRQELRQYCTAGSTMATGR